MIITESKNENYLTEVTNQSAVIFCDSSEKKGEDEHYLSPHELLCAGLASCLNITTRMILDHKSIAYDKVITKVDLDKSEDNIAKFMYHIDILGDIPDETKQHIKDIAKNSPVIKTLLREIEFGIME